MITRFAVDTSAVVDLMRVDRSTPPQLLQDEVKVFLPLPALGELYVGALSSIRRDFNMNLLRRVALRWPLLEPHEPTAQIYAQLRVQSRNISTLSASKLNDLWIAALCIQHDLPLLTNDHGFDAIAGLQVIHW
jgi:tRNA(fMet)-specific endonuclease VapC